MLPGKTAIHIFYVRSLNGSILSADSLPVGILIRNGVDTVIPVTVTQLVDNSYLCSAEIPSNWAEGDFVHLRITAVSLGITLSETVELGIISKPLATIESAIADIPTSTLTTDEHSWLETLYRALGAQSGTPMTVKWNPTDPEKRPTEQAFGGITLTFTYQSDRVIVERAP